MSGSLGKIHFNEIFEAIKSGDHTRSMRLVEAAFEDPGITEPELAQICDLIFHTQTERLYAFLGKFSDRYPTSVFPAKAQIATLLATRKKLDTAATLAREHLRSLRDRGALEKVNEAFPLADGAGRAFLTLSGAYTLCGARSYSLRLLEMAKRYVSGTPEILEAVEREMANVQNELESSEASAFDERWESFFKDGQSPETLIEECRKVQMESLALRTQLIADQLCHSKQFSVDEHEVFLLVRVGKQKDAPTPIYLFN